MSWQSYVDVQMVGTGFISRGAIIGSNGGIWAASPNFKIDAKEAAALTQCFQSVDAASSNGLYLNGEKYVLLRGNDRTVLGKKGSAGCHCVKTKKAILIGVYDEGILPTNVSTTMEKLADYLISLDY
ncbi:hypothetical protein SeMB42_g00112 [Synchytrium endobioticum]|uniref:Profilin n=1 Tax=Synchytrium endobioticum TaxID=286115 RepID=A0A507DL78_9FUNG|nr:hypothetical protein SeLEV6574_g00204 [Synchytrium endobioticum]TPX54853.1 hypothetical protein SeMB42_g00112 [Synchytrium endobioticum]